APTARATTSTRQGRRMLPAASSAASRIELGTSGGPRDEQEEMIDPGNDAQRLLALEVVAHAMPGGVSVVGHDPTVDLHRAELLGLDRAQLQLRHLRAERLLHQGG